MRKMVDLYRYFLIVTFSLWCCASTLAQQSALAPPSASQLGDIPLIFEPNQGQALPDVRFVSRAQGLTVLLKDDEVTLMASGDRHNQTPALVHMRLVGSAPSQAVASEKQESVSNYLMGTNPSNWRSGIPNFGRVRYPGIYSGIDLDLYGNRRRLEHDFIVAPRADYRQILVRLEGAKKLSLNHNGSLQVETPGGNLIFQRPEIYQFVASKKMFVEGRYTLVSEDEFRFELGAYNHELPLVIDPVLSYSTYLAGSSGDIASAIAVDKQGDAYITGLTFSIDFPLQSPIQGTCSNICQGGDVFVTKLSPAGAHLIYSTFIGGGQQEQPYAIAVDGSGYAAVAGSTSSLDFPQKNGTAVVLSSFGTHGFAFELNPSGSAFTFSTYLGGENSDSATGVATDSLGNVYVAGYTGSAFFRVSPTNQIGPAPGNFGTDLFVVKFSRKGIPTFSTLIGGSSLSFPGTFNYQGTPISVAVDSAGEAVLSGPALDGFPTTSGAYQPDYRGGSNNVVNGFLAKLDSAGDSILAATYLGGSGGDYPHAVALDTLGNIYLTGTTSSHDFPSTSNAFQTTFVQGSSSVGFVSKLNPTLSALTYSTFLGGTVADFSSTTANGLAVDANDNTFIVGTTGQPSFPLVNPIVGALPLGNFGNGGSAFLSVLNPTGSALTFSTFFTGSSGTSGAGVALNTAGDAFITGTTFDADFPTTPGSYQPTFVTTPFSQHAFATKFSMAKANAGACLSASSLFFGTVKPGDSTFPQPVTITNCGSLPLKVSSVSVTNPFYVITQNTCKTVTVGASCSISVRYSPAVADGSDIASLQIKDNAALPLQNIQLNGFSALPSFQIFAGDLTLPDSIVGLTSTPAFIQIQTFGTLPLHVTSATATGDFAAVNQCPADLFPGNGCLIAVTFSPKAAGLRTGTLSIFDDAPGSPQTLNLSGTGLTSYPVPTLSFLSPASAVVGSPAVSVAISGDQIFSTTKVTANSKAVSTTYDPLFGLRFTIPASMLTSMSELAIQLVNPGPGGGASAPALFTVYKQIKLGAADLVYEPFTRRLYATIPARAPASPNTFVSVDPTTGLLGAHVPVGNDPGAMGLSSDGTTLYVALNGSNSIVPVNVGTRTPGVEIPLGADPQRGPLNANRIQVQPGQANSFVSTLNAGFGGPDGIAWFKNGKLVTQFLNGSPASVSINDPIFVSSTDVYGWGGSFNGSGIEHFILTSNGMLEAPGFVETLGLGAFDTDGTNLYDVTGQVFSVKTGALVGSMGQFFSSASAVLTDTSSGRTFVLTVFPGVMGFDSKSLAQVGITAQLNTSTAGDRLLHWGADGLAFLTSNPFTNTFDLILMRTSLFYPAAGPNAIPVPTSLSPASVTSKGPNFVLTVNGSHFVRGAVVLWNGTPRTTRWATASKLAVDIPAPDIKAPGTAQITVSNPAPGGGVSSPLTITLK